MSGFAGLWIGIGLFFIGLGIDAGLQKIAEAIRFMRVIR